MMDNGSKYAFTLAEVLIVTLVFSFLTAAIYGVLLSGNQALQANQAYFIVQQQARNSLIKMTRELRKATSVSVPLEGGDTVNCQITPLVGAAYGLSFYLNGSNEIIKRIDGLDTETITEGISDLAFYTQGNVVKIEVTSQRTSMGRVHSFSLKVKVRARNL